jgi:Na+/H+ antiporter NhaD/arsenite permease-like protein
MLELALPNTHALAVMILIIGALVLFTRETIPLQTTSLVVLVTITVGFTLFPFEADGKVLQASDFFLGFGNKALVAVCGLMLVGQGLIRTGALEPVGRFLARLWRRAPAVSLLFTILITAILSAFINNTPIVVLMLPILIGVSMRTGASPSGTLIPMGFASIMGGMSTTIGTSTNLLVVNVATDMGMDQFSMFDFLGPAVIAGFFAVIYLWLVAPRLIPERQPPMSGKVSRVYTAQIKVCSSIRSPTLYSKTVTASQPAIRKAISGNSQESWVAHCFPVTMPSTRHTPSVTKGNKLPKW